MDEQLKYQQEGDPSVPGRLKSVWIDTTAETDFPVATDWVTADVAVLGGGIVGITTSLLLKEAGLKVVLIESGRVADGVSGHTTAKITSQHGLIYDHLISAFGVEQARIYANASEWAITQIESIVRKFNIQCDFLRTPAYTFAETQEDAEAVRKEVDAAIRLGLPASYELKLPIPIASWGAVKFANQAQFHARKYLLALVDRIPGDGSAVYENTRALKIEEGEPCIVTTNKGFIKARDVVAATHVPFFKEPGFFFARLYQYRSYLFGLYIGGEIPEGMFYSTRGHTIRTQPMEKGTMLLVGGASHKAGQGGDIVERYDTLLSYYQHLMPVQEVVYHWSTQDPDTPDKVPYIGRASAHSKHIYVASGFRKWGMTNGTVAATLISDAILARANPWQELYDPSRVDIVPSASRLLSENANVAQHYIGDRFQPGERVALSNLAPGFGTIGKLDGETVGVYKDSKGKVHAVSPNCSFEGCRLEWNNAEKTWDCPCCGSRFNYDGTLVMGPASMDLKTEKMIES